MTETAAVNVSDQQRKWFLNRGRFMKLKTRRSKIITVVLLILIILTVAFIWSNSFKDSDSSHSDSNAVIEFFRPFLEMLGVTAKKTQVYFIR